jgi:Domain of unknown function (DUF4468) with TBP-like fold
MKLLFVILLGLGSFSPAIAQDQTTSLHLPVDSSTHLVAYSGVVRSEHDVPELFNRALEWLDTAFRYSTSEIRLADMSLGKVVSRQTVQLIISGVSYNLSCTVTFQIHSGTCQYTFTNIFLDRIGPGIPIVRCEDLIHATKKQYTEWSGTLVVGGIQKLVDQLLGPIDGSVRQLVASVTRSMTR